MTDPELLVAKARYLQLADRADQLWEAKLAAADAWQAVQLLADALKLDIEREEQHRQWRAQWQARQQGPSSNEPTALPLAP